MLFADPSGHIPIPATDPATWDRIFVLIKGAAAVIAGVIIGKSIPHSNDDERSDDAPTPCPAPPRPDSQEAGNPTVKDPASAGSMQKEVEKGKAPREVDRVDKPHVTGQKSHVHFKDGTSMNYDGTVHDAHNGTPNPSNKTIDWLNDHGWKVM